MEKHTTTANFIAESVRLSRRGETAKSAQSMRTAYALGAQWAEVKEEHVLHFSSDVIREVIKTLSSEDIYLDADFWRELGAGQRELAQAFCALPGGVSACYARSSFEAHRAPWLLLHDVADHGLSLKEASCGLVDALLLQADGWEGVEIN